jgi:hypothetical protein
MFTRICPPSLSSCCPVTLGFLSSCCTFPLSFGFFKDADSYIGPPSDLITAVGASDQAVSSRMVWDDEFIAAALKASEGSVRHGACRPFWLALANCVVSPAWVARLCAGKDGSQAGCAEAARSLAFASALAGMPLWARRAGPPGTP